MPKRPELALKSGKNKGLKKSQVETHKRTADVWKIAGKGDYYESEAYKSLVEAQKQSNIPREEKVDAYKEEGFDKDGFKDGVHKTGLLLEE
tara:strand:+ start:66 stop:338 length:273 start_codon:yes stop_codon:yes gene_type:complete